MELLRVRERGQITISKRLRKQLGVGENSTLLAYVENGRLILEPLPQPRGDLLSIIGLLPVRGEVDVKAARREAQRQRAERWAECQGEGNSFPPHRPARRRAAAQGYCRCQETEREAVAARDPAGWAFCKPAGRPDPRGHADGPCQRLDVPHGSHRA